MRTGYGFPGQLRSDALREGLRLPAVPGGFEDIRAPGPSRSQLIDAAASLDPRFFLDEIEQSRATLCGRSPIALWLRTLAFLKGDEIFQETLDYQTSGDITGDYDHTVSYGALGYFPVQSFWVDAPERACCSKAPARRSAVCAPPANIGPFRRAASRRPSHERRLFSSDCTRGRVSSAASATGWAARAWPRPCRR